MLASFGAEKLVTWPSRLKCRISTVVSSGISKELRTAPSLSSTVIWPAVNSVSAPNLRLVTAAFFSSVIRRYLAVFRAEKSNSVAELSDVTYKERSERPNSHISHLDVSLLD